MSDSTFLSLLRDQIRSEFTASQQYTAVAVWLDDEDLPQLAAHFYAQALEERNHAMSMVQYLLDTDVKPIIPGIDAVQNEFASVEAVVELALEQEKQVTQQITTLARTARDEGDYLGEQFMQWFLKEQVEEVSSMSTLLTVVRRAGETSSTSRTSSTASSPRARPRTRPRRRWRAAGSDRPRAAQRRVTCLPARASRAVCSAVVRSPVWARAWSSRAANAAAGAAHS